VGSLLVTTTHHRGALLQRTAPARCPGALPCRAIAASRRLGGSPGLGGSGRAGR
jgi:hypothetical protein